MRIPFDITKRPQIESGEYKVETRDGKPTRIVCWDRVAKVEQPTDLKLCVLVQENGGESVYYYYPDGKKWITNDDYDLFIITPEPELSEFEDKLRIICENAVKEAYLSPGRTSEEFAKNHAAELLSLARDQFIKDGYVIEKKAFHDAVEKVAPEVMKEVSENIGQLTEFEERIFKLLRQYKECDIPLTPENIKAEASMLWPDFEKYFFDLYGREGEGDSALRSFYYRGLADGKAEASKDLPRWRKWGNGAAGNSDGHPIALVSGAGGIRFVSVLGTTGEKYIMLADLKKLPGFKEDE